jgi:hypothetical protein
MIEIGIPVISAMIAAGSLMIGVVTFRREVKKHQDQRNAQLFLEFTKRFEEVMQSFPKNAWPARLDIEKPPPPRSKALSLSVLRYLNLCSEEFYLCEKGWLHMDIWKIWEDELLRTLQTPLFVREWQHLCREFESYPEFKEYVEEAQNGIAADFPNSLK